MFVPNFRLIELLELKIHGWDNFIPPQVWGALKSPGRIGLKCAEARFSTDNQRRVKDPLKHLTWSVLAKRC